MADALTPEKIISRIRKLLAMAEDTSSPNEAAIAASRAARLMEKYNIEQAEVLLENPSLIEFGESGSVPTWASIPGWANIMTPPLADLFECIAVMCWAPNQDQAQRVIVFKGVREDAQVAAYTFDYLVNQINGLAEQFRREYKRRSGRGPARASMNDFRFAAAKEINKTIRQEAASKYSQPEAGKGRELMVCKKQLVTEKFGQQRTKKVGKSVRDVNAMREGQAAGRSVSIRQGVGRGQRAGLLS